MTPVELLKSMFQAAVDAALPSICVPAHLPPRPKGRTIIIGAGKASAPWHQRSKTPGRDRSRDWS